MMHPSAHFQPQFPPQLPGISHYALPQMYAPPFHNHPNAMHDVRATHPQQGPTIHMGLTAGTATKRLAPAAPHPAESPAKKKQSKWTADEDAEIIRHRGNGMKWEDISKQLPGRSAISCRLRFQNYLERRSEWDEEKKNKLARLYERYVHGDASFATSSLFLLPPLPFLHVPTNAYRHT